MNTLKENKRTGNQCISVTLEELMQLASYAKAFSLSALRIKKQLSGNHLSPLLGRGMEFVGSRRYQIQDDIRHIDWKTTARSGKTHTKLFSEEKEREVILCGDLSASMFFATQGVFKSVQAALMMSHLAWSAVKAGHRLGGVIYNDLHHNEYRPTRGQRGILPFLQGLVDSTMSRPNPSEASPTKMCQALEELERVASPGSLIVVVSDFRHLTADLHDRLIQLGRQSDLFLCMIFDPLEKSWPKQGTYSVGIGDKFLQINVSTKKKMESYHRQFLERRDKVKSLTNFGRIHFMECCTDQDCLEVLKEYFN
ncbi:MAG: DUF58 domain-containing protein [Parachlamydiaceae bacterium]|nr:DUF58 domain-containing protein [Parachlamydiaceae bacterium]